MSYVPGVGSEIGRVGGFIDTIEEKTNMEIVGLSILNLTW